MKKIVLVSLSLLVAAAAVALMLMRGEPAWTTDSPRAAAAFERCLDAYMKFYHADAREACAEALEADPGFVVARLRLAMLVDDKAEREELLAAVRAAETEELTPRERFLVRYNLARIDHGREDAAWVLADYLESHPRDPFALWASCHQAWMEKDWQEAEACYERLLEVDPNWVQARNHLGYIAMAQGRFAEAEDLFETYLYVAPDQANPHDSLGELLTVVGRYEEAEAQFERALAVRPDFCVSYAHLVTLYVVWQRFDEAERTLDRMLGVEPCADFMVEGIRCTLDVWQAAFRQDWAEAWSAARDGCLEAGGDVLVMGHTAAVRSGDVEAALALEERSAEMIAKAKGADRDVARALLLHMQGTRFEVAGELEVAADHFRRADQALGYWANAGLGLFKLFNQRSLARTLEEMGRTGEAEEVRAAIAEVNPRFVEQHCKGE